MLLRICNVNDFSIYCVIFLLYSSTADDYRSLHLDRNASRSVLFPTREESRQGRYVNPTSQDEEEEKKRKEDEEAEKQKAIQRWASYDQKEKEKREHHRRKVIEEILSTENTYVLALTTLQTHYVQPLKSSNAPKQYQLTEQEITQLCNNLETLHKFHHVR